MIAAVDDSTAQILAAYRDFAARLQGAVVLSMTRPSATPMPVELNALTALEREQGAAHARMLREAAQGVASDAISVSSGEHTASFLDTVSSFVSALTSEHIERHCAHLRIMAREASRTLNSFFWRLDGLQKTGMSPANAQVKAREQYLASQPAGQFMDAAGRRWKGETLVFTNTYALLRRVWNEVTLMSAAHQGHTAIAWHAPDGEALLGVEDQILSLEYAENPRGRGYFSLNGK